MSGKCVSLEMRFSAWTNAPAGSDPAVSTFRNSSSVSAAGTRDGRVHAAPAATAVANAAMTTDRWLTAPQRDIR